MDEEQKEEEEEEEEALPPPLLHPPPFPLLLPLLTYSSVHLNTYLLFTIQHYKESSLRILSSFINKQSFL